VKTTLDVSLNTLLPIFQGIVDLVPFLLDYMIPAVSASAVFLSSIEGPTGDHFALSMFAIWMPIENIGITIWKNAFFSFYFLIFSSCPSQECYDGCKKPTPRNELCRPCST